MSCAEFERLLEDAAERRVDVDNDLLDPHAANCASCRTLREGTRLLDRSIAAWQAATPEIDLTDAVLARWAFGDTGDNGDADADVAAVDVAREQAAEKLQQPVGRAKRWRTIGRQLTTAAMLAATIVILINSWRRFEAWQQARTSRQPETPIIAQAPSVSPSMDSNDVEADTLLRNAGTAYRVLAVDAANAVADASKLVAATNRITPAPPATSTPDGAADNRANGWDRDLEPIGKQFGEALDFLFELAPEAPPSI